MRTWTLAVIAVLTAISIAVGLAWVAVSLALFGLTLLSTPEEPQ